MLKTKRNKVTAAILMVVLLMTFSMSAFAESGTHSAKFTSNGKVLTHTETYSGTYQKLEARVSCPGARNAQVTMLVYYTESPGKGDLYAGNNGKPYSSYVEPGTSAAVVYRPQTNTYCFSGLATYFVDNAQVWNNTFVGYK